MKLLAKAPESKPLYDALGVREDATPEQIRDAYRRIAKRHHPDVTGGQPDEVYLAAKRAYEILSDPGMRAAYDLDGVDPGTRIKSLERVAMELVVNAAYQCIGDYGGEGNLLQQMRDFLQRDAKQTDMELRRVDAVIAKADKAKANVEARWSGAEAPRAAVLAMIDEQRSKDAATRVLTQQKADFLKMALDILEPASYAVPTAADIASEHNRRFLSSLRGHAWPTP